MIEPRPGKPVTLPTYYDEHRFFVRPVTTTGVTLNLFSDTGGGLFLFEDVAARLGLPVITVESDGEATKVVALPAFKPDADIPPPSILEGRLPLLARNKERDHLSDASGMLGQAWFRGRVWTFDYPGRRLLLRATGDVPRVAAPNRVALGFRKNLFGKPVNGFARIAVGVAGEPLDMLFDTGATNVLPEPVLKQVGDGRPAQRATSFITRTVYERWRKQHPDWRAVENVKTLSGDALIEVPEVTVGGYKVGPVWFTRQPDRAFHEYMAQWMDRPTEGALGGSALRYLRVTVDYPNATAVFER